jgi:hypothetical protein
MSIKLIVYLLYWYFQQNQCLNIKKHTIHKIHRLAWGCYARGPLSNCQHVHALRRHCPQVDVPLYITTPNYETLFFRFKKANHRYWKLINYALTWARPNLLLSIFLPVALMLQHVVFAYLANTTVLCYSLTIICCCQVQNYIYWIISTENDHRHHHIFVKYEKRLRKEGNMPRLTY